VSITPAEGVAVRIVAAAPKGPEAGTGASTQPSRLVGKISSVDGAKVVLRTWSAGAKEPTKTTVLTNDKTVVTVDGKAAKVSDLNPNLYATVILGGGAATRIEAKTPAGRN
jgi:hypothetical protein